MSGHERDVLIVRYLDGNATAEELAALNDLLKIDAESRSLLREASFQALPVFVRFADVNVTLRTLGGPAILLIWLYVMANVIIFGAEVNWWWRERHRELSAASEQLEPDGSAPPSSGPPVPRPSGPRSPE